MKRIAYLAATVAFLAATSAQAAVDPEALGRDWWSQGFTGIEVTVGRSQVKVEGIRGGQKVEVIYDAATGAELKREVEAAEAGDDNHNGISIRQRNRDFVRVGSGDDDSGDDDHGGSDDDGDDDDNSGHGSGGDDSDDDGDDDSGHSGGNDDDDNDDHGDDDHGGHGSDDGSDHDSNDDRGGDDD